MKLEYTRPEALRMFGVTERQLRSWEDRGLIVPAQTYGFQQLRVLRKLSEFKQQKLSTQRIERALKVVSGMPGVDNPLSDAKVFVEGNRIQAHVGKMRLDADRGQFLLNFDDPGEAPAAVTMSVPPPPTDAKKVQEAETWFLRGVELEQTGAPIEEAVDAYEIATSLDPKLAAAWVNLGTIHFTGGDHAKAAKFYTKALEANPDYPLGHFNMGNLYDERGEKEKALEHYRRALELDPAYSDAHYNVALLHQSRGEMMKAVAHWRSYLKGDPDSQWAQVARREMGKLIDAAVVHGRGNVKQR